MGARDCHQVYTDSVPTSWVRAGSWANRSYGRSRAHRGSDEPVIQPCVHRNPGQVFTFAPNVFSSPPDVFTESAFRLPQQSKEPGGESAGVGLGSGCSSGTEWPKEGASGRASCFGDYGHDLDVGDQAAVVLDQQLPVREQRQVPLHCALTDPPNSLQRDGSANSGSDSDA